MDSEKTRRSHNWNQGVFPTWAKMLVAVAVVLLFSLIFFRVRSFEVSGNVRYTAEAQAWKAMQAPGTIRLDEATVRYLGEDYKEAFTAFLAGTTLAGTFRDDADLYC